MATEIVLRKLYDKLIPVDAIGLETMEELTANADYRATLTRPRNLPFHRKFFALVKVAFDAWEAPALEYNGAQVTKNLERFRKDLIIQCGFYDATVSLGGKLRLEPKSIRFDRMDEEEFAKLYSTAIDVILGKILLNYTREDLDHQVERILRFL